MTDFEFENRAPAPAEESFPTGARFFPTDFRARELLEGHLVDVSPMARQAGFRCPVAVTRALWEDINTLPEAYRHEDVPGRLWDVLFLARQAIRESEPHKREILYHLVLHTDRASLYPVKLLCEPGDGLEPAITLFNPDRDIRVSLGQIVFTEGALEAFVSSGASPTPYLLCHRRGEWGELDAEDRAANDRAAREGGRLLSAYTLPGTGDRIWLITEWDRSVSTFLLPAEY